MNCNSQNLKHNCGANASYALITPACNEAEHLPRLIAAIQAQTQPPQRWIIVNDGSTDTTAAIAQAAAAASTFIDVVHRPPGNRDFAAKVAAINAGIQALSLPQYAFIGIADADIEPAPSYYEAVLAEFAQNPHLGIAGGMIVEFDGWQWRQRHGNSVHSVAGAIQLFRRQCYTAIGGLPALPFGGEDTVAEVMAREHQWQVKALPELVVRHHRQSGFADGDSYAIRSREGRMDYGIGYLPLYELLSCTRRLPQPPRLLGSCYRFFGYCAAAWQRQPYQVSAEVIQAVRRQQRRRLRCVFSAIMPTKS